MHPPIDWDRLPNFAEHEFRCQETGECAMSPAFLDCLQGLRTFVDAPFPIGSGFRSARHSKEARKAKPGAHAYGVASDIRCHGELAYRIVAAAPRFGFVGIGVNQTGPVASRFIHLDTWRGGPRPRIWSY